MNVLNSSLPAWHAGLAPGHSRTSAGALQIGGVDVAELAAMYGTPLLVLDLDTVDASIAAFKTACEPAGIGISYATKALLLLGLARHLRDAGIGLDVASLGELSTAERAGFPPHLLTLHGAGKSDAELEAAREGRAGRIVVDSLDELQALGELGNCNADVYLRLNTGIEAHTHAFIRTAGSDTKFGISAAHEDDARALLLRYPGLRLRGLHAHIGSQIYDADPFAANVSALIDAFERFTHAGFAIDTIVAGGGFGVMTRPDATDEVLDVGPIAAALRAAIDAAVRGRGIPTPAIEIEPGRSLVAHAGTSIYRVLAVKDQDGTRYAIVDGSLADNPRPALYDAYHHFTAERASSDMMPTVVCGKSCENDELGSIPLPRDLRRGDLIAMCTTGAYTYSMASNYNRFSRPAVIALKGGAHIPFARRETIDDVMRNDC